MTEENDFYELLIPPGTPRSIIADTLKKYDVELVKRPQRMYLAAMDGDVRELLAFRGKKDVIEEVQEFVLKELKEFIGED